MRLLRSFFLLILASSLFACEAGEPIEPRVIENAEGGALLVEATRAAQRVISEHKTATIQAATMSAGATREASDRSTTGTAQALQVRQQEMNLNATSNAVGLQQMETRQAATETSEAWRSEATGTAASNNAAASETAVARARNIVGSRTADAIEATDTALAATSTRSAQEIQAALERHQATATAEALEIRRAQAQDDAARYARWAEFFDTLLKIILGLGSIALLVMLIVQLARYLDAIALRQKLVETRSGTVLIVASPSGYTAEIIRPTTNLLDEGANNFGDTQAPVIGNEASELLKLTNARGETFITKTDPEVEAREARRRLALRLLRASLQHYATLRIDARDVNRIPSFRDLGWSSETWVRAVQSLKPYVIAKAGRGGGTYCGAEFPTVMTLYIAVGERRIGLSEESNHSPALAEVSG